MHRLRVVISQLSLLWFCMAVAVGIQAEEAISVEPAPLLSEAELDELVAPVALYPDDLLAIVLPAATYPLQIVAAARYREAAQNDPKLEPDEYWDESIVALLNYPEALQLLNEDLDWTWELGQAVAEQQQEVLAAVTRFRNEAYAAGNLETDENQVVTVEDEAVTITPADPEVVHVPYYEPEEVTVYQTERVYHYYPSAYPVYYYPYSYRHRFYDQNTFWGVSSVFLLSWDNFYLSHYNHHNYRHPFYGRTYYRDHFRRTHRYNAPGAYQRRYKYRQDIDRHWRPNRYYAGARPHYKKREQRRERHLRHRRYTDNNYAALNQRRVVGGPRQHNRSSVHRNPGQEINSVQRGNRAQQRQRNQTAEGDRKRRTERQSRRANQPQNRPKQRQREVMQGNPRVRPQLAGKKQQARKNRVERPKRAHASKRDINEQMRYAVKQSRKQQQRNANRSGERRQQAQTQRPRQQVAQRSARPNQRVAQQAQMRVKPQRAQRQARQQVKPQRQQRQVQKQQRRQEPSRNRSQRVQRAERRVAASAHQ